MLKAIAVVMTFAASVYSIVADDDRGDALLWNLTCVVLWTNELCRCNPNKRSGT